MYIAILLPIPGVRAAFFFMVLLMIRFPGPADEFQLINFILQFKGVQFFSQGFGFMAKGVFKYWSCYNYHEDVRICVDHNGAGASQDLSHICVDYLSAIMFVWSAFFLLPNSNRLQINFKGRVLKEHWKEQEHRGKANSSTKAEDVATVSQDQTSPKGGAGMRTLLRYDAKCFLLSMVLLLVSTVSAKQRSPDLLTHLTSPQFKESAYWCTVFHAVLSVPFSVFSIPVFLQIFTPVEFTGYNEHGACVGYLLPDPDTEREAGRPVHRRLSRVWDVPHVYAQLRQHCGHCCRQNVGDNYDVLAEPLLHEEREHGIGGEELVDGTDRAAALFVAGGAEDVCSDPGDVFAIDDPVEISRGDFKELCGKVTEVGVDGYKVKLDIGEERWFPSSEMKPPTQLSPRAELARSLVEHAGEQHAV